MASKRGRLSSIDLLPEEAHPHVRAAIDALTQRKRPQDDIREELNGHLLALGFNPVSRSAFNRKALALSEVGERIRQGREMAAIFAEKMDEAPQGDVGLLINETIKTLVYDVIMDQALSDSSASMKMLKEASITLFRLEQARKISVKVHGEITDRVIEQTSEVVEAAVKERGLSRETAEDIKAKILGIAKPQ